MVKGGSVAFKTGYKRFIEDNFQVINKKNEIVDFILNPIQNKFIQEDADGERDVILKARQQGFSSLILGIFATDFLLKKFSHSVIVADNRENAQGLLERVKFYIESYEIKNKIKIPMKYNTRYELQNEITKSKYTVGTAQNVEFGRSKTLTNLHFSESAFYPDMERLLAGAMQAVTEDGRVIVETTANGFNYFRDFWMECKAGKRNFKPSFYNAQDFYSKEFLDRKRKELGRLYKQEYPRSDAEAFLASGDTYFDRESLDYYIQNKKTPIRNFKYGFYDFL